METVEGFNFISPTFVGVTDGSINIQDIKVANAENLNDNIQILDEGGAVAEMYYYYGSVGGWVELPAFVAADVEIKPGQSVLLSTPTTRTVTFSGAVNTSDTVITTVPGFNFIGNNTPVAIDIQDIAIENGVNLSDNIQILDAGGAVKAYYYYYSGSWWEFSSTYSGIASYTLEPGDGVLISTETSKTVTIPGVSL